MMYRVLILEDNEAAADSLKAAVERCPYASDLCVRWIDPSSSQMPESLLPQPHILLADIELGEGLPSGIEFIKEHYPEGYGTQVVYVTGHIEYCTAVYQTDHVSFLLKPVQQADLDFAMGKAIERIERSSRDVLPIHEGNATHMVPTNEIDYIESRRRKVVIHCGERELTAYAKLSDVAESLPGNFLRCHQSFVVNMDRIVSLHPNRILLSSGAGIPVSQSRRKQVEGALAGFYRASQGV